MNFMLNFAGSLRQVVARHWFWFALAALFFVASFGREFSSDSKTNDADETRPIEKRTAPSAEGKPSKITEKNDENPLVDQSEMFGSSSQDDSSSFDFGEADRQAFLNRFTKVALAEQQKFGIPASVILGCGLVQSQAGRSELALRANNFFGIPGSGFSSNGKKWASYKTAWDCFRANSLALDRHFPALKGKKWQTWAAALVKAGYSDLPDFEAQLSRVILENRLHELDATGK